MRNLASPSIPSDQIMLHNRRHHSLSTIAEEPSHSTTRTHQNSDAHCQDPKALLVKLRNPHANPPKKKLFHLPKDRLLQTSAYFRNHVNMLSNLSPSAASKSSKPSLPLPSKHNDGIIRLNFPDFEIFGIYDEWLRSATIHTKASLRLFHANQDARNNGRAENGRPSAVRDRESDEDTIHAFQDYLGAYFLGTWLQDTVFKDTLISLILTAVNSSDRNSSPSSNGNARTFLAALKPSLVELILTDERSTRGMRRLIYAAIGTFAEPEDMSRLVPDEGRTCERGFVRGLLLYLLVAQRHRRSEQEHPESTPRGDRRYAKDEEEIESLSGEEENKEDGWAITKYYPSQPAPETQLSMAQRPPPFMPRPEDMWEAMSHVSWPSTSAAISVSGNLSSVQGEENVSDTMTLVSAAETGTNHSGTETGTEKSSVTGEDTLKYVEWPKTGDGYCVFHEHTFLGLPCYRDSKE